MGILRFNYRSEAIGGYTDITVVYPVHLSPAVQTAARGAVEGKYKAGVIYDPTPYGVGTFEGDLWMLYNFYDSFDYNDLYRECEKRTPVGEMSSMEAALKANPKRDWNYTVPISKADGFSYLKVYDYYLVRGYAVVEASGIGTYGSEGFELCGFPLERDSHVAVVEWLTGNRRAFTDKTHNIEIKADWSNGKVAMTGCSYGGTLPFEVATTGVKGLETIIPYAGISSWYDYTNSQGVCTITSVNYADFLAGYNCGGTFLDRDWTVTNKEYGAWLYQISLDQEATKGNYAPIWDETNYAKDWENINCSALIVHGLNDLNVTTLQADMMVRAFQNAKQNVKVVWHQDGHNYIYNTIVNGELWDEIQNRWLAHYLLDIDNGAENMPAVLAQSNVDGSWKEYKSWGDFNYKYASVSYDANRKVITSKRLANYAIRYMQYNNPDYSNVENMEDYFLNLPDKHAAVYPVELAENTTVYGVPEINLKLSSEIMNDKGLMVTAVLIDTMDDGSSFDAYLLKERINRKLPVREIDILDGIGYKGETPVILEYVQDRTKGKVISFGWTDLTNPGGGYDSRDYTDTKELIAGEFYDYTLYMLPTVYTVAPGHSLKLVLTTWDPYRVFLDRSFETLNIDENGEYIDYDYSYIIDNSALRVMIPVAE